MEKLTYHTFNFILPIFKNALPLFFRPKAGLKMDQHGRNCQVGILAGPAYLLNDDANVPRTAQEEKKSQVEQKDTI